MNENISKMLELLSQDEETMKKLSAIRDPDEAYAFCHLLSWLSRVTGR